MVRDVEVRKCCGRGPVSARAPNTKHRGGVTLPDECWEWLRVTADRDGSSRDELIEGLVLLGMDADKPGDE